MNNPKPGDIIIRYAQETPFVIYKCTAQRYFSIEKSILDTELLASNTKFFVWFDNYTVLFDNYIISSSQEEKNGLFKLQIIPQKDLILYSHWIYHSPSYYNLLKE